LNKILTDHGGINGQNPTENLKCGKFPARLDQGGPPSEGFRDIAGNNPTVTISEQAPKVKTVLAPAHINQL
jgi:hypothetical protein